MTKFCFPKGNTISRKHGMDGTKIYRVWCHMRERCMNPRNIGWSNYGGRGIRVCDQWSDFSVFYSDMGDVPDGKTLDRIDNNGDYSPDNCRWATPKEQGCNRRSNLLLTAFGETKSAFEWTQDLRCTVPYSGLIKRIQYGWSHQEAVSSPPRTHPSRRTAP
jgi:hypothetical protein